MAFFTKWLQNYFISEYKSKFEIFKDSVFNYISPTNLASLVKFAQIVKLYKRNFLFERGGFNEMKLYYLLKGDLKYVISNLENQPVDSKKAQNRRNTIDYE